MDEKTSMLRVLGLSLAVLLLLPAATFADDAAPPASPPTPAPSPAPEEPETVLEAVPAPQGAVPLEGSVLLRGGSDYRIGRQDLLEIRVFDLDQLNQTVRVADDGSITLPLLGRLAVAGLSKSELEALIARLLEARYVRDPQVTIFVKEYESKKVAVSGAVKKPGTYEMLGEKTLLEMISLAGGLDREMGKQIIIFRRDDASTRRLSVDLERLVYDADPALNLSVVPGDIIYVPTVETVRIFVSGAVRNPNLYEVPRNEPVTVLKAITIAGGTTDRAAEGRVQVIRTDPATGARTTLAVDLKKVKKGKVADPLLEKDDLVLVPEAFF